MGLPGTCHSERKAGQGKGLWRRRLPQQEGTVRKEEGKPARNLGFERRVVEEDGLRVGGKTRACKVAVGFGNERVKGLR